MGLGPSYHSANYSLLTLVAYLPSFCHLPTPWLCMWRPGSPKSFLGSGGTQTKKGCRENRRRRDMLFFLWRNTSSERLSSFCMSPSQEGRRSLAQNPLCA